MLKRYWLFCGYQEVNSGEGGGFFDFLMGKKAAGTVPVAAPVTAEAGTLPAAAPPRGFFAGLSGLGEKPMSPAVDLPEPMDSGSAPGPAAVPPAPAAPARVGGARRTRHRKSRSRRHTSRR